MTVPPPPLAGERRPERPVREKDDRIERTSSFAPTADELFELFKELKSAGYRVDAEHLAAAQKLVLDVLAWEGAVPVRRLRTLLAPVFVRTPEQQTDFYRRFEEWLDQTGRRLAITGHAPPQPSPGVESGQTEAVMRRGRRWPVVATLTTALLALGLAAGYWQASQDLEEAPLPRSSSERPPEPQPVERPPDDGTRPETVVEVPRPLATAARVVLALVPLASFGGWLFLRWRRRQLWLERRRAGKTADLGRLRIAASFDRLFTSPAFRSSAQDFRRSHRLASPHLDLSRTVTATAASAGLFSPVYEQRPHTPEYLFLIEQAGAHDHVARLFDEAVERLRDEGVFIDRYYFFSDPRLCFADDRMRTPTTLKELASRRHDRCLLVIGTADGFFHPVTGELEGWLEHFEDWPSRVLVSTRPHPLDRWSLEEIELLEPGFSLASATPRGMRAIAQHAVFPVEEQTPTILDGYPPLGMPRHRLRREQLTKRAADVHTETTAGPDVVPDLAEIDVFIAADRQERRRSGLIAKKLGGLGLRAWSDDDIPLGAGFRDEFNRRAEQARAILVCWTGAAAASGWILSAADIARHRSNMVSCALDELGAPEAYQDLQTADLRDWEGADDHPEWRSVLERIGTLTGRPSLVSGSPLTGPPQDEAGRRSDGLTGGDPEAAEISAMLRELESSKTAHRRRAEIGERLDALGDPRRGVGVDADGTPDIDWCAVPAGVVGIQVERRFLIPGTRRMLKQVESFEIARNLITVVQYRAFLEAEDGWRIQEWWEPDLDRDPKGDCYEIGRFGNYPAVNVSWFDALAFCRWLTRRLGCTVRLPDEWEWQHAATGGHGEKVFPWGNAWDSGRANTFESGLGGVTAVGMYPSGASIVGALDMAGTVWEWCSNAYKKPARMASLASSPATRGGSWDVGREHARCSVRNRYYADGRNEDLGFRVMRHPPDAP